MYRGYWLRLALKNVHIMNEYVRRIPTYFMG